MNTTRKTMPKKVPVHQGQNIKRIRLLLGIAQKEVAAALGAGWTQKKVSRVESTPNVLLRVRQQLAQFYAIDMALFDTFDEAAGRLALIYIMKIKKQLAFWHDDDDERMLEDITGLLEKASVAIDRERQNMQLLLRLLQQIKFKSASWREKPPSQWPDGVKEPALRYGKVA
ncbi:helix-turn-helix domain-containing protein [Arachidicoccus terrestris]|uniref:helix-turn-helix domain-containing protein n=1 Tax=Arachidicoccus terrestris TaxID=2875539 RepID=UPI001CC79231|nr:helix-turn-helix transcriptional regulator [Arachidicoccus terrestris]UAY55578.1 helix-turn-helix domain-containing protein [Arachidicoccus terrestris]